MSLLILLPDLCEGLDHPGDSFHLLLDEAPGHHVEFLGFNLSTGLNLVHRRLM